MEGLPHPHFGDESVPRGCQCAVGSIGRRALTCAFHFQDPYAAFFKMDTDLNGIVSMQDLRRLLQHLLFSLKDEEFERFLSLLGLRLNVTLNFREFRNLFEKRPLRRDDAPQRLIR